MDEPYVTLYDADCATYSRNSRRNDLRLSDCRIVNLWSSPLRTVLRQLFLLFSVLRRFYLHVISAPRSVRYLSIRHFGASWLTRCFIVRHQMDRGVGL